MNNELRKYEKDKNAAVAKNKWKEAADHCNYIGSELCRLGDWELALQFHNEELSYNNIIGNRLGAAVAHRRIGECYSQANKFEKALNHIELFKKIATEESNIVEEQRAWATLGRTYYLKYLFELESSGLIKAEDIYKRAQESSDLTKAEDSYNRALKLVKDLECRLSRKDLECQLTEKDCAEMKARLNLNLGLLHEYRKDILKCGKCISKAICLARKFNLLEDLNRCQSSLASVYQKHGQYAEALKLLEEAISSAESLKDETLQCDELYTKATILLSLKDFDGAKHSLKAAYKLKSPLKEDHERVSKALKICVGLCMFQNKLQNIDISDSEERKVLLERIADGLSSLECYKLAIEFYFSTLQCMEEGAFSKSEMAPIYFSIAMSYKDMGDIDKALEYLNKELMCNEDKPKEQIKTMFKMAEILEEAENISKTEEILMKAVALAERNECNVLRYRAITKMFNLFKQNNMTRKANEINKMLKNKSNQDFSNDESDVEEESQDPFKDIHLSDLSDSGDGAPNVVAAKSSRRKRQPKKPALKINDKGETPLHKACIEGKFNEVKKLVECGHSVTVEDNAGWNPLHEASNHGHYDIVEYLLDKGAPINKRGAGGITALHDAASNGNLDVVQLLIARGASVTVLDDDGLTPLQTLLVWEKANNLDEGTLRLCKKIEEELKSKMLQAGQPAQMLQVSQPAKDVEVDEIPENFFEGDYEDEPMCRVSPERVAEKRSRPASFSSSEEEYSDDTVDIESCPSQLRTISGCTSDWDTANGAQSEYKAVMSNLRRSAKSIISEPRIVQKEVEKKSGLVDEAKVNDWLVLDTKQECKTQRKRRKVPRLNVRTSKSLYNYLEPKSNFESLPSEEREVSIIEDDSNDNLQLVNSSNQHKDLEIRDSPPTNLSIASTSKLPFWLKVWVCDKCIHVPVPEDSLSIEWLAEEASNRYQYENLSKPHLTSLMKMDGGILLNTDIIKSSLVHNEELKSTVVKWDEPTLEERYVHLCKRQKVEPLLAVQKELVKFNTSSEINFSNRLIDVQHINFIFESLSRFKNILHLNFKGTMIISSNVPSIISGFPSFVSLVTLDLSCCSLFTDTLRHFSEYLDHQTSPEKKFPCLKTLNLNYNLFCAPCSSYINSLIQIPSLTTLGLSNCDLYPMTFEDLNLCQTLEHCSNLQELNIAGNILTDQSMQNLLHHLPKLNLVKMDLACTAGQCPDFAKYLKNYITSEFPQLAELSLERCNLTDQDLLLFTPAQFNGLPKLKYIDLFGNNKLSASAVTHFLKVASNKERPLDIHLCGTCEWDINSVLEFIDQIDFRSLSSVKLSNVSKVGQEELFEWWKRSFNDKAECIESLVCKISLL